MPISTGIKAHDFGLPDESGTLRLATSVMITVLTRMPALRF